MHWDQLDNACQMLWDVCRKLTPKAAVRQLQLAGKTAPAPSSSVLVNVKVQTSQAGVNSNDAQAASGYKSA